MSMSRKDFQAIAEALSKERPSLETALPQWLQWKQDVRAVAKVLSLCNPAFNRDRFLTACGADDQ